MAPKVLHGFCRRTLYEAGGEEGGAVAHKTPKSTIDLLRDFLFPVPFFSPSFVGNGLGKNWAKNGAADTRQVYRLFLAFLRIAIAQVFIST